jgi:ABC-2 type transport system permease protein
MTVLGRYLRLYFALGRYGLIRELAFQGNFVVKVSVEVLWLGILLLFYRTVFSKTSVVADWSESEYLFFLGCYFALSGLIEALFLINCSEFADLVRTGDLDFYLLKPIDEQFLVSCRNVDWSSVPNLLMGAAVMGFALYQQPGWEFAPGRAAAFLVLFVCGTAIAYGFLLLLTSTAVWFKRNQSLYEMWWLFTSLMRYPREIFKGPWADALGKLFTYVIPILLVINVPAGVMVKFLDDPVMIGLTVLVAVILLVVSRQFFRHALRRYRSASS